MKALLGPICLLFASLLAAPAPAQDTQPSAENKAAADTVTTNATAITNTAPAVKTEVAVPSSGPSVAAEAPALPVRPTNATACESPPASA